MFAAFDISFAFYYSFLFVLAMGAYFAFGNALLRKLIIIVLSYVIYYSVSGYLVFILFFLTLSDYSLVRAMARWPGWKRACLIVSVAINLAVLGYFKYADFFLGEFGVLFQKLGLSIEGGSLVLLVPIGLSFIVFHGISFAADAYRGKLKETPGLIDYFLYLSYFPKILSGPIERFGSFREKSGGINRVSLERSVSGGELILLGLFKKIVIAALFFQYWDEFRQIENGGPFVVYAAGAAYGLFLLADFSGYTDIARGLSRMLGIELERNFWRPYGATSFSEFWRRWHMSLSFWFRDYVYIPLGGSRNGLSKTIRNLVMTMTLCGLWHGAAWTFILWGLAHGIFMSVERLFQARLPGLLPAWPIRLALTSFFLSATWILFASADIGAAAAVFGNVGSIGGAETARLALICAILFVLGPLASYFGVYAMVLEKAGSRNAYAFILNTALTLAVLFQLWKGGGVSEFVYFRF